ncbi:MAG: DUF805 domain-containing protein [Brevirhabdus sp.]
MMKFDEAIKSCFRKYTIFSGRAQRSEYWWFMLFNLFGNIANASLDVMVFGPNPDGSGGLFSVMFALGMALPLLSVTARRLHDMNRSAWWMAAPYGLLFVTILSAGLELNIFAGAGIIATIVLFLMLFIWTIMRGTEGPNRFGYDPLGAAFADSRIPEVDRD